MEGAKAKLSERRDAARHLNAEEKINGPDFLGEKCASKSRGDQCGWFQQRPLQLQLQSRRAEIVKVHRLHDVSVRAETFADGDVVVLLR